MNHCMGKMQKSCVGTYLDAIETATRLALNGPVLDIASPQNEDVRMEWVSRDILRLDERGQSCHSRRSLLFL